MRINKQQEFSLKNKSCKVRRIVLSLQHMKWTLINGTIKTECSSFPFAFRTAHTAMRKATEAKQNPSFIAKQITILGPVNARGERMKYSYTMASQLAIDTGLMNSNGDINSKEFKKR